MVNGKKKEYRWKIKPEHEMSRFNVEDVKTLQSFFENEFERVSIQKEMFDFFLKNIQDDNLDILHQKVRDLYEKENKELHEKEYITESTTHSKKKRSDRFYKIINELNDKLRESLETQIYFIGRKGEKRKDYCWKFAKAQRLPKLTKELTKNGKIVSILVNTQILDSHEELSLLNKVSISLETIREEFRKVETELEEWKKEKESGKKIPEPQRTFEQFHNKKVKEQICKKISFQLLIQGLMNKFKNVDLDDDEFRDTIDFLISIEEFKDINILLSFLEWPLLSSDNYVRILDKIMMLNKKKNVNIICKYLNSHSIYLRQSAFCVLVMNGYEGLALNKLKDIYMPPLHFDIAKNSLLFSLEIEFYLNWLSLVVNEEILDFIDLISENETNEFIIEMLFLRLTRTLDEVESKKVSLSSIFIDKIKVTLCKLADKMEPAGCPFIIPYEPYFVAKTVLKHASIGLSKVYLLKLLNDEIPNDIKENSLEILKKYHGYRKND